MFVGMYQTKFSGKGRVVLPKKFRSELTGNEIILSRGFEGCILGFSKEVWETEAEKALQISVTEERARSLRRYLFSASENVELDEQGRFVIPAVLVDFGKLRDKVVLIGAGDHFEVWDNTGWSKQLKRLEEDYGRIS